MKRLILSLFTTLLVVVPVSSQGTAATARDPDAETRQIITDWVKGLTSQRNDLALERDIRKWWKGPDPAIIPDPIIKIYFLQPAYAIERNQYGNVLRKHVDSLILWKTKDGSKCHIQWRSFGYDSLGAGTFSDEMQAYIKREFIGFDYYAVRIRLPGYKEVQAGVWYEVNCAAFR